MWRIYSNMITCTCHCLIYFNGFLFMLSVSCEASILTYDCCKYDENSDFRGSERAARALSTARTLCCSWYSALQFKYTRPKPNIALWDPPGPWLFSFQMKFHYFYGVRSLGPTFLLPPTEYECHWGSWNNS